MSYSKHLETTLSNEIRLQRAEKLIRKLMETKTSIKFCRFCGGKLSKGHVAMCPIEEAQSFLAEGKDEEVG